jgi:hypothetical protein
MAKSSNTGEPKARRTPTRRRTDKAQPVSAPVSEMAPPSAPEEVATAPGATHAPMTEPASMHPMAVIGDTSGTTREDLRVADPNRAEIKRRAYELYLERGGQDGRDLEDWLEAERQLKGR